MGVEADEEGENRRAGQGRGGDEPGLERAVPELEQVDRQQQADQPVAEGAQPRAASRSRASGAAPSGRTAPHPRTLRPRAAHLSA